MILHEFESFKYARTYKVVVFHSIWYCWSSWNAFIGVLFLITSWQRSGEPKLHPANIITILLVQKGPILELPSIQICNSKLLHVSKTIKGWPASFFLEKEHLLYYALFWQSWVTLFIIWNRAGNETVIMKSLVMHKIKKHCGESCFW